VEDHARQPFRTAGAGAGRSAGAARRAHAAALDGRVRGQDDILGPGKLLRRAIASDRLFSSIILWGPPGTGKTTLASIIALHTKSRFASISAVLSGVAELRELIASAKEARQRSRARTIVLVDEIHRWNKSQQDALLPHVEDGSIVLIGATTENPYFEVIRALVSRARIFQLRPLAAHDIATLLRRALADPDRGYGARAVAVDDDAINHWADLCGGDARAALSALELAVESTPPDPDGVTRIDLRVAQESIQRRAVRYDKKADEHYDTISAFIKSVRGSDPDAALYWLAKMVHAGEDPEFIMRRLIILAAEDIGLADPRGITVATSCAQALQYVGLPEAEFHLALATVYLPRRRRATPCSRTSRPRASSSAPAARRSRSTCAIRAATPRPWVTVPTTSIPTIIRAITSPSTTCPTTCGRSSGIGRPTKASSARSPSVCGAGASRGEAAAATAPAAR
jgi:putative ATPase